LSQPDRPTKPDEPAFAEPWQAEAFALAVALSERGLFTWSEWAEALGAELKQGAPDGSDYFERWVAALELLLRERDITGAAEIGELAAAWQRAAHATPHGKPILLENDPRGALTTGSLHRTQSAPTSRP
jgi:nitrile hydratase accessory protein